jgi:hypothetical protein
MRMRKIPARLATPASLPTIIVRTVVLSVAVLITAIWVADNTLSRRPKRAADSICITVRDSYFVRNFFECGRQGAGSVIYQGRISLFGGPDDAGVKPNEGLALYDASTQIAKSGVFLQQQPPGTDGLARRLNPATYYVAARWDFDVTPMDYLRGILVVVSNPRLGIMAAASPVDWGPAPWTGREIDLSPALAEYLHLTTDDIGSVIVPK